MDPVYKRSYESPKEQIEAFKKAGKVILKKYMDDIKAVETQVKWSN